MPQDTQQTTAMGSTKKAFISLASTPISICADQYALLMTDKVVDH